ncbi:MAG TPA: LLM class flavin-dependent oxidoreductase [Candidatus Binataceae bacterium]|nr:LLM class flavin-dependent oxidoreductase [Candidatus Binataceae bacterium]
MKIGIFYELQLPRPWKPDSELKLFQDSLAQVELADRLGFDYVWAVEHHFLEEYAHCSAPEVFLAACSQRTRHIRLGHGVVLMPPGYNHPARVAERIATLDLVSNGRVEFGTGESSSEAELGGFGIARGNKRAMWQEALEATCRMMAEEPFRGHAGQYFQMPVRNVVPKPVQKPHPPVWVACSRRETIHLAAQLGVGALSFTFMSPDEARQWAADYYATLENESVPIAAAVNPNLAIITGFMCDRDAARARTTAEDGLRFFAYALGHYYLFGRHEPARTDIWKNYRANPLSLPIIDGATSCVGTPDQVRKSLCAFEDAGIDQVVLVSQAGNNSHEDICASLELVAREVLPEFQDRDRQRAKLKAERMAPIIERAMKRKPAPKIADEGPTTIQAGALP